MISWIYIKELSIAVSRTDDIAKICGVISKFYEENKKYLATFGIQQNNGEMIISNIPIDLAVKLENEFINKKVQNES